MGKKRIKAAVALATAAVTATAPGSYMPGLMTALAAEQNSADLKVVNTSVSPGNGQVYHGCKDFYIRNLCAHSVSRRWMGRCI